MKIHFFFYLFIFFFFFFFGGGGWVGGGGGEGQGGCELRSEAFVNIQKKNIFLGGGRGGGRGGSVWMRMEM